MEPTPEVTHLCYVERVPFSDAEFDFGTKPVATVHAEVDINAEPVAAAVQVEFDFNKEPVAAVQAKSDSNAQAELVFGTQAEVDFNNEPPAAVQAEFDLSAQVASDFSAQTEFHFKQAAVAAVQAQTDFGAQAEFNFSEFDFGAEAVAPGREEFDFSQFDFNAEAEDNATPPAYASCVEFAGQLTPPPSEKKKRRAYDAELEGNMPKIRKINWGCV